MSTHSVPGRMDAPEATVNGAPCLVPAIEWGDAFWRNVHPEALSGCWLWHGAINDAGYGRFGRSERAHRVAYELRHGPIPAGAFVLHRCDVRACVNPDHISVGTHADNMRDMARKGRANVPRGVRNPHARLTEEQVREIRQRAHESRASIAREFGVHASQVSRIARGRQWAGTP